jgi:uncharacterized protein
MDLLTIQQMFYQMVRGFLILLCVWSAPAFSTAQTTAEALSNAALELTKHKVIYDPSYFSIGYPNGDVPADRGVCTDVVIRAYRKVGIDLQQRVHEDMKSNLQVYPKKWGLAKTDRNIDHRRVPNLMTFFSRHGQSLAVSAAASDYKAGDIVTWDLGGGVTHIGLVVNQPSPSDKSRLMIVHNIGAGQVLDDVLFNYPITGHYRYGLKSNAQASE